MIYVWIFVGCYAVVFVTMFFHLMSKTAASVRVFQSQGIPESEIDGFRREMFPKTCLVLVWSTFFTGSILGAIGAGVFWLIDR